MKSIISIVAIALLLNNSQAVKIRDLGELDLPTLTDESDVLQDKKIIVEQKKLQSFVQTDKNLISNFELQLDQGLRNAQQGEMGRALAISKLETIKTSVATLEKNLAEESQSVQTSVNEMLKKHQPSELDLSMIKGLEEKGKEIIAQIPKINQLENVLEIQDEDAELAAVQQKIQKTISNAKAQIENGNKQIQQKVGAIPDAAKVLTEKQYEDQMSFVLKH